MIICPYCGTENYIGVRHCKNCLNRLRDLTEREIKILIEMGEEESAEKKLRRKLIWTKIGTRT